MGITLMISVIAFSILGTAWILVRMRLQDMIDYTDNLKTRVAVYLSNRPRRSPSPVSSLLLTLPALQPRIADPNGFNQYLIGGYVIMSGLALATCSISTCASVTCRRISPCCRNCYRKINGRDARSRRTDHRPAVWYTLPCENGGGEVVRSQRAFHV